MFQKSRSHVPVPPPGAKDLPYDDGEPMESERHVKQMTLLTQSLSLAWKDRQDFYVGGNMFLYFSELQTKKNDFRGPDVFVVLDTVKKERLSWVVWEEGGRTPDVVIELLSESTEDVDRGEKMQVYARVLMVGEYYLFDPWTGVLEGYALDRASRTYRRMEALDERGTVPCEQLGLRLGVVPGRYHDLEMGFLRWIDQDSRVLPTGEELAAAASARAEQESARAEQESARAEQESARADQESARAEQESARADHETTLRREAELRSAELERRIAELEGKKAAGGVGP
jgi:Uma2 family endonuclease